ncbi:uncharacterized protein LAESUDRAFT_756706 [Laetiporus sulphureus 93-53]|uniref:Uncharacterized protein n=1 Tax=Laetiporus sulphureus 93-53 TaxID=1314785 RepID=A0A165G3V1_9APHY|nr:uncharacterized protein LAESUDRAFT_756706 [Laetiporus sulphureus 93-53]KZT09792.1 hypothetical protein LAESUDRAFT_756706 [Laetiporus sulphureus 93-53]
MPFSCEVVTNAINSLALAITAVSLVITLQRVYAVAGRNWFSIVIGALLAVVLLVIETVEDFVNESTEVIVLGSTAICYTFPQNSFASTSSKLSLLQMSHTHRHFVVATAALVISLVMNVVAVGVVWRMLYRNLSRKCPGVFSQRRSLATLLLRDGTIQFVTLLLLNVSVRVLSLIGQNAQYIFCNLNKPLTTILVSRLLLNIQETARAAWKGQSDTPSFVRSNGGVQTESNIDIPSLVIPSDAANSVPAIDLETGPSIATANLANAVADEAMIAGPPNQDRHREAQEVSVPMEAGPSGQGPEDDVAQGRAEGEAAEDWEEEDDWEDDY